MHGRLQLNRLFDHETPVRTEQPGKILTAEIPCFNSGIFFLSGAFFLLKSGNCDSPGAIFCCVLHSREWAAAFNEKFLDERSTEHL
jgi:hypothetical protein